ncbi:MAG TPA: 4-alpha-glucanotransferase [Melioribacteraceae bacterium]|nr:4-alpha-glucanotransferase [Melioribacteraceae bacterium]
MKIERSAGILLHPTSLPGRFGIGDLGPEAYSFVDFMKSAGQTLWQVFPLGPTGYGDSPYQSFSAFAGNPLLISPELLYRDGLLEKSDIDHTPHFNSHKIDFGNLIDYKTEMLKKSFAKFLSIENKFDEEFNQFSEKNNYWLDDFSLFMAAKEFHNGVVWSQWDNSIAFRKGDAVEKWKQKLSAEVKYFKFVQFIFDRQWRNLKEYVHNSGIKVIGDLPIFIAYDSADLWSNRDQFTVKEDGSLEFKAGVPPDYFSATGQLWGNPLYRWKVMEKDNFHWWQRRISKLLELVDIIRIDHFRGFDAYWEIPGDAETAIKGRWVKAPGEKLFSTIKNNLGELPIIAEDLGVITPSVEELRDKFQFPGIKILQFAFGENMEKKFLPHNHIPNCVIHTGSHDNETTRGFFESEKKKNSGVYEWAQRYLNYYGNDIVFELIKRSYSSVSNIVVIPMQDILNLGNEARMNVPSTLGGNWTWRFTWDQVDYSLSERYKEMTVMFERPKLKRDDTVKIEVEDE